MKRLGPYHHARLAALEAKADVTAIEIVREDATYAWRRESHARQNPVIHLFEKENELATADIRARVFDVLDRLTPDAVCVPGWSSAAALSALDWCLLRGVPAVLMSDSTARDAPRKPMREAVKAIIVRMFGSAVVAGAPHVEYVRSLGLPADRIFTGFDVVDNDYFAREVAVVRAAPETFRQRLSLPDRYFLASARFVRKKNLSGLLDAYAGYLRLNGGETWPLVIVGDGELAGEIRNKIVEYGMTERVLTPGFVQYDALPAYYGLASAFVHASTTEQWGLVVNEAMASGLPVLVSKNCGCAEDLVEDGVNGFTFDPADPAALAASMSRMSSGALVLGAMGEASRRIISRWSPERFADGVVTACDAARRHAGSRRPAPVRRLFLRGMQIIRRPEAGAEFNAPGVS